MSATDNFPRLAFGDIAFPYQRISIKGSLRDVTHEYPHVDGGRNEKLGLKNYVIEVETRFQNTFINPIFKNNYPGDLSRLVRLFENKVTQELMIPSTGPMQAYCQNWDRVLDAKIRSGESVHLSFKQDDEELFLGEAVLQANEAQVTSLADTVFEFFPPDLQAGPAQPLPSDEKAKVGGILSGLRDTISSIKNFKRDLELFSYSVRNSYNDIASLCDQLSGSTRTLGDPRNHKASAAVRALWAASLRASGAANAEGIKLISYVVPRQQSVGQISTYLYGSPRRGTDILRLNPIDDAFKVPAGMRLRVLDPVKAAA